MLPQHWQRHAKQLQRPQPRWQPARDLKPVAVALQIVVRQKEAVMEQEHCWHWHYLHHAKKMSSGRFHRRQQMLH